MLTPILISPQDLIITTEQTFEDTTIILDGNLIIRDGGGLTLNSSKIQMNCQYEGQYKIHVKSSALYLRLNSSEIKAVNSNYPFSFVCQGQEFKMKNSKLSNVGWGEFEEINDLPTDGDKGLVITSPSTVIDSSEISDCNTGLILNADSVSVTNCTIKTVVVHGILLWNTKFARIENNLIESDESSGLIQLRGGSENQILNNKLISPYIEGATHGIRIMQSNNNLIHGNFIDSYGIGVFMLGPGHRNIISNNVIKSGEMAIQVWGWNNQVIDNTLYPFETWNGDPINLVYAYNTEVINNRIVDLLKYGGAGIWLRHSSNNLIKDNNIQVLPPDHYSHNTKGIFITESSSHNIIHSNQISGSVRGIVVSYSSNDNKIYNNNLSEITYQGFLFDETENNIIYDNNTLNNVGRQSFDDGNNTWNYSGAEPVLTLATQPVFNNVYEEIITGDVLIENQTINFHYAVLVEGASLTLRNVTLITGVDTNDISYIDLPANASLEIYDSKILQHEYGTGFTMDAAQGSNYILKDTEIRGAGHEYWYRGIFIMADDFDIENCTFYNALIVFLGCNGGRFVGNKVYNSYSSILFQDNPSNITITDNIIDGSMSTAIFGHSQNMTIKNNQISNVWGGAGINLDGFKDCLIEDNIIYNIYEPNSGIEAVWQGSKAIGNQIYNAHIGIKDNSFITEIYDNQISQCRIGFLTKSTNQSISNNKITDCSVGLYLDGTANTLLSKFVITDCDTGVYISENAENNTLYRNDFTENRIQVVASESSLTNWDEHEELTGVGNYWSDYTGIDANNDGIGDTPYQINRNARDRFPLMQPGNESFDAIDIDVNAEDKTPQYYQAGSTHVLIAKLSVQVATKDSGKTAILQGLRIDRNGTGVDIDIPLLNIWRDSDGNASFNTQSDSLIGQGTFWDGTVTINFLNDEIITSNATCLFVTVNIAQTVSDTSNTIGFSCQDSTYFITKFPDIMKNTNFPLVFSEATLPVQRDNSTILKFNLRNNYPNPFNPSTFINYTLPIEGNVTIIIYDILGRKVHELISQNQLAGNYSIQWNGTDRQGNPVSTGIYFYQIQAGDFVQTKKMVLLK